MLDIRDTYAPSGACALSQVGTGGVARGQSATPCHSYLPFPSVGRKREALGELLYSTLFKPGRLSLTLLGCTPDIPP